MCPMTPAQRIFTTIGQKEPDRVPLLLTLTHHGAKELGLSIKDYYSQANNVVEGQVRLQKKYGHDAFYPFFHGPLEYEAWGGEVIFSEDGPPNTGEPLLPASAPISALRVPEVQHSPGLLRALEAMAGMKAVAKDEIPVLGVVMSPFSLPVVQLGFDRYMDLLLGDREAFWRLMEINIPFCQAWSNAQLDAGATLIAYFDPLASPTMIPAELYRETGHVAAKTCFAGVKGPTAIHLGSGRTLGVIDELVETGTLIVGTSSEEDLDLVKAKAAGRITVLGNLNGIAMASWSAAEAEEHVKSIIAKAGRGGGFILGDTHGEIPWQVTDEVLMAIADAVRAWGTYPLDRAPVHA